MQKGENENNYAFFSYNIWENGKWSKYWSRSASTSSSLASAAAAEEAAENDDSASMMIKKEKVSQPVKN